jgi:hypothetical protein
VVTIIPRAFDIPPEITRLATIVIQYQIFIAKYHKIINFMLFVRKRRMMNVQICELVCAIHEIFQTLAFGSASGEILDDSVWLLYMTI